MEDNFIIVAADGSGHFTSVQEAVDQIPDDNKERVIIYIKNGIYKEKLHINKPFVKLLGEDPEKTILTYDDAARKLLDNGEEMGTFRSYSTFIGGDDFIAENITFENSAGRGDLVGQALAIYVKGDRAVFRNCRFLGHQDTLFTGPLPGEAATVSSRQYYERCTIVGDVDFIFGSATAVFNQCEIISLDRNKDVNGYITAASTPADKEYGYVFLDCKLTSDAAPNTVYLGRPWRPYSNVCFINCWMGEHIKAEGWHNWGKEENEKTARYYEYNSSGPGGNMEQRVSWSKILTDEEAKKYTISQILSGDDGWNPAAETISVYIAGDSTACNYTEDRAPRMGWGQAIGRLFKEGVVVKNHASSGRSSKSFINEGRLDIILAEIKAGDYLFIQFGHNDQKEDEERRTEPYTTYKEYLTRYIEGAREKGANPVLLTPISRRSFNSDGTIADTHGEYPKAMKELAEELKVPLIDMTEKTKKLFEKLGEEETKQIFLWLKPGEHVNYPDGIKDNTHLQERGAVEVAKLVLEGIKENKLSLEYFIDKDNIK